MYIVGGGLPLTPDINGNNPVIGINNLVTTTNITADYALATNPVTNLANPSTALSWKSGATIAQTVTVSLTGSQAVDYLAVAGGNFGSAAIPVNAQGWDGTYILGTNLRAINLPILSEAGYPLLTEGGVQILNEGTTARIGDATGAGGLAAAFDNTTAQAAAACAQKAAATDAYVGTDFTKTAAGKRIFEAIIFGSNDQGYVSSINPTVTATLWGKTGTVAPANSADGTNLGSISFTDTANESAGRTITSTDQATLYNYVWVEFAQNGAANAINVAEVQIYESLQNWTDLTTATTPTDDLPTIFRFPRKASLQGIRLQMGAGGTAAARASVIYTGTCLPLQRRVYVGHTPIGMGRNTSVVTGMSESGNFLGRIVVGESRKTTVSLKNIDPIWYRNNMDSFASSAQTSPFFFAWRPATYPNETGYAWLTGDVVPSNQSPNGYMQVAFSIAGVAS